MKVVITYFKTTGKYYTMGEYNTQKKQLFEIWDEVEEMFNKGKRPGLIDGFDGFHAVVEVPEHEHNHPRMFPGTDHQYFRRI